MNELLSRLRGSTALGRRLEVIARDLQFRRRGRAYIEHGELELGPFKPVTTGLVPGWLADPFANRSWRWRLNWLSLLSLCIAYHAETGDSNALDVAATALDDWLDRFLAPSPEADLEFIWHDHGAALRAEQIALLMACAVRDAPDWCELHPAALERWQQALLVHGRFLAEPAYYSVHTNHGVEQSRVLLLLGRLFGDSTEGNDWQRLALARLDDELLHAFTSEGVHVENSPGYHNFVFKVFLGVVEGETAEDLGPFGARFRALAPKLLDFTTHIIRPDGLMPILGDTEQIKPTDGFREHLLGTTEYSEFRYVFTGGAGGRMPKRLNRVYPASGYAVFRDRWPTRDEPRWATQVIVKMGSLSHYHRQQDEGHVLVFRNGEDWLIDSGLYNYVRDAPIRKYMRSRAAHNVPAVADTAYLPDDELLCAWRVLDYSEEPGSPFVHFDNDVYVDVKISRRVSLLNERLEVADEITVLDGEPRPVTFRWHLPSDKRVALVDSTRVVITARDGAGMQIAIGSDTPRTITRRVGEVDGKIHSLVSLRTDSVRPSQVLLVQFEPRTHLVVHTSFAFQDQPAPGGDVQPKSEGE